jgi:TolB-like protein
MKYCPKCNRTYTDETLNFCLEDGGWLLGASKSDEPLTAILASEAPTRVSGAPAVPDSAPKPISPFKRNPVIAGIIGVLLLTAFGVAGYWLFSARASKQIESIAVMPFVNEGGHPDMEYLSDGMTETLISSLTQLPDLAVKPRSSVFRYKGKDADAKTIGRELNVAAILNGTVVQRGSDMTLHVELVDTATETLLWSADYKRSLANLVALQSEITRDVVDKLKLKLNRTDEQKLAKNYTENAEAYQLYLQGRYLWNKQSNKDIERSIEFFQKAIEIDPNYALAYTGLSDAYAINVVGADRERMAKAKAAALKAISLDNNLAEAHASLGRPLATDDYDFAGAEREFRRAIELNPNYGNAHQFLADLLSILGRHDEAVVEIQRALDVEPFRLANRSFYARFLVRARKYDEAIAYAKSTTELDANFPGSYGVLSSAYELTGRYPECIEARARAFELSGDAEAATRIRDIFAKDGWEGYNRYLTGENRPKNLTSYSLAVAFMSLGEREKAFDALKKSYESHEITLIQNLNTDPRIDSLRNDPRFHELMKQVGFAK